VVSNCTAQSNTGNGIQVGQDGMVSDCIVRGSTVTAGIVGGIGSLVKGSTSSSNTGTAKGILVGDYSSVINCVAANNVAIGIEAGEHSVVKDCVARSNGGTHGILATNGTLTNCTAAENDGIGLAAGTVTGCTVNSNGGSGITSALTVSGCTAQSNGNDGIVAIKVTDSTVTGNTADGIVATLATGCIAQNNNRGFSATTAVNCTATSNTTTGVGGTTAINCTATSNGGVGIVAATATGCKTSNNASHGIQVSKLAQNNECTSNGTGAAGGAGIVVTVTRVRVDGNTCTNNDWGIQLINSNNISDALIIRNYCANNTTAPTNASGATSGFDFDREFQGNGGKMYGYIVGNVGELESGNSFSNNPWANFEK
jgi:parallel beta-helix repeat protein